MLKYYSNPMPGVGLSFHKIITDQGANLAAQIEAHSTEDVGKKLAEVYEKMAAPSGPSISMSCKSVGITRTVIVLSFAQAAILAVISFGFVAVGVCVLVGPVFIPFLHRSANGVDVLGLVQGADPVRLLPGDRERVRLRIRGSSVLNFFDLHKPPYDTAADMPGSSCRS